MNDTLPEMYACKNCGFKSTRSNLFQIVEGILLCAVCLEGYVEYILNWKAIKPV